jgi:hypothetical protein
VKAVIEQSRWGARRDTGGKSAPHRLRQIKIRRYVMKTIRSLTILAGLSLALLTLGVTGAKAQSLSISDFAGTFTLPFEAQWGRTTLPAGEYSLYYGQPLAGGHLFVEVVGKEKGSPHVFILPKGVNDASTTQSALVCVREGNAGIVRGLEMAEIGQSASFAMPHGAKLVAQNGKHNGYTQLAQAPMLIERIPITLNAK